MGLLFTYLKGSKYLEQSHLEKDTVFMLNVCERGNILYRKYMKGLPFLSKMIYQRVRIWGLERSLPVKKKKNIEYILPTPPGLDATLTHRPKRAQWY